MGLSDSHIDVLSDAFTEHVRPGELFQNIQKGEFGSGFIPNFNPIHEAIQREMGAGYLSSQIKIDKDPSLITSLNPQGLGVYNSTEGSLSTVI